MASAVPDNASVVADQTAVVVEERHAVGGGATPVVAGLAGSSGEPEIEDDANEDVQSVDSMPMTPSMIELGIDASVIEVGDLSLDPRNEPISKYFGADDWNQADTTFRIGDWHNERESDRTKVGQFGIENYNFGQHRHDSATFKQVCKVLKEGGSQLFTLQEAVPYLLTEITQGGELCGDVNRVQRTAVVAAHQRVQAASTWNQAATAAVTQQPDGSPAVVAAPHEIYFVSYPEGFHDNGTPIPTLAFGGRTSHIWGIRLVYFGRYHHGVYRKKNTKRRKKKAHEPAAKAYSVSRLAVAQYRMKRWRCGAEGTCTSLLFKGDTQLEGDMILSVANVHLHHALANHNDKVTGGDGEVKELKKFYDELAKLIVHFRVRLVNGDFNMDAIRAVTELRARGFCVNVASWCAWRKTGGEILPQEKILGPATTQLDSVLILVVGPTNGVRLPFDVSVFGMEPDSVVAEGCCN